MTPSQTCISLIQSFENCRLAAFLPTPKDRWTIGWGHTDGVQEGETCTQAQADAWFVDDLSDFAEGVSDHLTTPTTQNQFDALVSLAYNIGLENFETSTLLHMHNAGRYTDAANAFAAWCHQDGQVLQGLVRRRAAEAALYSKA